MTNTSKVLYLHGFASGPTSTKAGYFVDRLHSIGVQTDVPDLNQPNFSEMTLTSQLNIARDCLSRFAPDERSIIFGSSMGGLLATLLAQTENRVQALVLMAPGFGLPRRWNEMLGDEGLNEWRHSGRREVFQYGTNTAEQLNYDFIVDAENYETDQLAVSVPTIVFHGKNDETVPVEESIEFKKINPDLVNLEILNDDHTLINSLEYIWSATRSFLEKL